MLQGWEYGACVWLPDRDSAKVFKCVTNEDGVRGNFPIIREGFYGFAEVLRAMVDSLWNPWCFSYRSNGMAGLCGVERFEDCCSGLTCECLSL